MCLKFYVDLVPTPWCEFSAQFEVNQAMCLNTFTKGVEQQKYSHLIDIFLVLFGSWSIKMLKLESKNDFKLLDMMKNNTFE